MRFLHTGDLHCNRDRAQMVMDVIGKISETCIKAYDRHEPVDAVFICGDFWDSTITNTEASGFTDVLDAMENLKNSVSRVHMIYGTPSHEPMGSLHVFGKLGIDVLGKSESDSLGYGWNPYEPSYHPFDRPEDNNDEYEVIAIPEPRISLVEGRTLEEKYGRIQDSYRELTGIPKRKPHRIVMLHGLIHGAVLDNGMQVPKGGTAIDREVLDAMDADYIACAHIHRKQKVGGMRTPCWYCGSIPPRNFGETHEASFNLIEL